jgi:hypothetical protein
LSGNITAHVDTALSFVTGRGESKSRSRENVLLWKIILQNILAHTRIIKIHYIIKMLNCYCQLSSSVIFRQYGVSHSECKIDRPRPGLSRLSPRPHTKALGTRLIAFNNCSVEYPNQRPEVQSVTAVLNINRCIYSSNDLLHCFLMFSFYCFSSTF